MSTVAEHPDALRQTVGAVLAMADIPGEPALTPLSGGANNRVYRVDLPDRTLVLKEYFQHEDDPRDRLEAEYRFVRTAWGLGLRTLPRPIARLPLRGLGIYEFIPGRPPTQAEIAAEGVERAADFVLALNRLRAGVGGADEGEEPGRGDRPWIGEASDACGSLAEHLASIERRVERLSAIQPASDADARALALVKRELTPAWKRAAAAVRGEAGSAGVELGAAVEAGERFLSPSDFGFHNSILTPGGEWRFIDLEYAGWDDPAKLVCDFFTQVALPAPVERFEPFLERVTQCLGEPEGCRRRARMLLPAYRVKWCCLVLNEFLPAAAARRKFAIPEQDLEKHKLAQIEKARGLLEAAARLER